MKNQILSEKELAATLGLSHWTIRTLRLKLGLPHFRTDRRIFYRLEVVKEWMAAQEQASIPVAEESYGKLRQVK